METLIITTEKLNSANIAVKSEGWTDYELRADVTVNGNQVSNINGGQVRRLSDNTTVASFNIMGGMGGPGMTDNLTITYMVDDIAIQCEINKRVSDFVGAVKAKPLKLSNLSF